MKEVLLTWFFSPVMLGISGDIRLERDFGLNHVLRTTRIELSCGGAATVLQRSVLGVPRWSNLPPDATQDVVLT